MPERSVESGISVPRQSDDDLNEQKEFIRRVVPVKPTLPKKLLTALPSRRIITALALTLVSKLMSVFIGWGGGGGGSAVWAGCQIRRHPLFSLTRARILISSSFSFSFTTATSWSSYALRDCPVQMHSVLVRPSCDHLLLNRIGCY